MMTVGDLINQLQKLDENMEVIVPQKIDEFCFADVFTGNFYVQESSFFDPSVEGEEVWMVEIHPCL